MRQDLEDRVIVITGANSGIGLVAARSLAAAGAEIVMLCRDPVRGEAARREVAGVASCKPPILLGAELDRQDSIRAVAAELGRLRPRVDVLLNNAGAVFRKRETTLDGIERCFATNHLAPFLLTLLVLPLLRAAPAGRIVTVASRVHAADLDFDNLQGERRFSAMSAYGASKLENILFTYELARRVAGGTVTANCLAPGLVATNFGRDAGGLIGWIPRLLALTPLSVTPEQGAMTSVYLAASPEVAGVSGQYFYKCRPARSKPISYDGDVARRLWETSARLVGADLP